MTPDLPAPRPDADADRPSGARFVILVAAVVFASLGILSLAAILVTAFLQGPVWPGFVLGTYVCLPLAFLLMALLIIVSAIERRRT